MELATVILLAVLCLVQPPVQSLLGAIKGITKRRIRDWKREHRRGH